MNNIKTFVIIALYSSIFFILSLFGTINFEGMKLTVQNLPLYIGAITLGSSSGALIGFIGMFLNQIVAYGFSATTLFWVLPQTLIGAVCGFLFENKKVKVGSGIKFWICIISLQVALTILNTVVIIIDSLIFGYFNYIFILGSLALRMMSSVLIGIIYCIIIPLIIKLIKKIH